MEDVAIFTTSVCKAITALFCHSFVENKNYYFQVSALYFQTKAVKYICFFYFKKVHIAL